MADVESEAGRSRESFSRGAEELRAGHVRAAEITFREGLALTPADPDLLRGLAGALARQGRVKDTIVCLVALARLDPTPDEVGDALEPYMDRYVNPAAVWGALFVIGFVLIGAAVLSAAGFTGVNATGTNEFSPIWGIAFLVSIVFGVSVVVFLISRRRMRDAFDEDIRRRYAAMGARTAEAVQQGAKEPQRQLAVLIGLPRLWRARRR